MHDGMHALRTLIVCVLAKVSGMACHGLKSVNYFPTACGRMEASGTASSASTPKTPPYISSVDQSVNPPPPTPRWPDGGIWNGTLGLYPQDPAIYGNLAGRPILPGCEPPVCLPTYYVSNGMGAIHAQVSQGGVGCCCRPSVLTILPARGVPLRPDHATRLTHPDTPAPHHRPSPSTLCPLRSCPSSLTGATSPVIIRP